MNEGIFIQNINANKWEKPLNKKSFNDLCFSTMKSPDKNLQNRLELDFAHLHNERVYEIVDHS